MGLGLSIALDIVRLHGGDLKVTSEEGRGSRFTVYLPVESHHSLARSPENQANTGH